MSKTYRYVVRPSSMLSTPRRVSAAISARGTRCALRTPDWHRDFFMSYVSAPHNVANADEAYQQLHSFYTMNKRDQRAAISGFSIKTPDFYRSSSYVVRPLRHRSGLGFKVTQDQSDFDPLREYISPLFDKKWEYRLLYVCGRHCLTLYKRVNPDTPSDVPWNHACGSRFETVEDWNRCRLRHTSVLADLENVPIIKSAHLIAVDVMLRNNSGTWEYAVCEFNFCPSLSIEGNLEKVASYAQCECE